MSCTVLFLMLASFSVLVAQTGSTDDALYAKQDKLRASGAAALKRVKSSKKADRCTRYGSGQPAVECLAIDLKAAERDERIYASAIGGMLRIVFPAAYETPSDPEDYKAALRAGDEFDAGEVAWQSYRQKTCSALYDYYAGGSIRGYAAINCRLSLIQSHMLELDDQYADLWH